MRDNRIVSFYPGPSQVYSQVGGYIQDALEQNVTGYNHRSPTFVEIVKELKRALFDKLEVPSEYELGFLGSATEAWGVIANSFKNIPIINLYNGSFGEKWFQINSQINLHAISMHFGLEEEISMPNQKGKAIICVCQNETSNGTQVSNEQLRNIKLCNPEALLAVDATSSMGGVYLDISQADIWFASVQKCFGLPAGLCVVLISPKVRGYFGYIDKQQYNNIVELYQKSKEYQTIHTPNTLGIYLLSRLMKDSECIKVIDESIKKRASEWRKFFKEQGLEVLSQNPFTQSDTVMTIKYDEERMVTLLADLTKEGFMLGKGYGKYAKTTFRIANFPAVSELDIVNLRKCLRAYL